MRSLAGCALLVVLAISIYSANAFAQQRGAPPQSGTSGDYDSLIDSALNEYRLGHWIEAKAYFTQAHAIAPNARTLRGLGLVCYELRKYVEAIQYFQQALANQTRPLTSDMREGVNHLLHEAERFVSRLDLQVTPAAAAISIDGRQAARDVDGKILIDAGNHELTAESDGYETTTRTLTTDGGEAIKLNIALRSNNPNLAEAPAPPATEPQTFAESEPEEPASSESLLPWVVVAASGAVMITGGVLLGVALSEKADIEDTPKGSRSWSEVESSADRVPVFSTVGAIMLGVGAAGVATGLAWKFWPKAASAESASVHVLPGGLLVRGKF